MDARPIRPSRWYYAIAAFVAVVGAGGFAWFLITSISAMMSSLQQVVAPGAWEIALPQAGNYTIFYEHRSVFDNKVYDTGRFSGLQIELLSNATRTQIPLSRPGMQSTYSVGGREGVSYLQFTINQPGAYTLQSQYMSAPGPEIVLAVGAETNAALFRTIGIGIAICLGSFGGALTIGIVTFVKRRRSKRMGDARRQTT